MGALRNSLPPSPPNGVQLDQPVDGPFNSNNNSMLLAVISRLAVRIHSALLAVIPNQVSKRYVLTLKSANYVT